MRNFSEMILDTELQQRTVLHLSLDPDPAKRGTLPLRQGRAIAWITEALDGLDDDLAREQLEQLVRGIRATIGIRRSSGSPTSQDSPGATPSQSPAGRHERSCGTP